MLSLSRVQSCISILGKVRFLLGGGGGWAGVEFFGEKRRGPPTSWNGFNACLFRNTQTKTSDPPPPAPPYLSKTKITGSENNKLEVLLILLVFSVTPPKIDQNHNQNHSTDKVQNLGNERR